MTVFDKILNGEIKSQKIFENDLVLVFLDAFPKVEGHTLIIPKISVDYFVDVPDIYYNEVFRVAKIIAPAIEKSVECVRIGMMVEGRQVPHFHLHLIPILDNESMLKNGAKEDEEVLDRIKNKIIKNLDM